MTKLLEKAVTAAEKLSGVDQDALAVIILEELADEERWADSFKKSGVQLSHYIGEALAEYKTGRAKPLDLSEG